jgi:oligopeptide/dipeptide ABC transporter ATP-binding protein
MSCLLEVKNLRTYFYTDDGVSRAVDDVSFHVEAGETLGVVGESSCGKSVTSLSILRLLPRQIAKIAGGEIWFRGENLLDKTEAEMQQIRGNKIAMIFQEPMTSLNPVYTIGFQLMETIVLHQKVNKKEAYKQAIKMLKLVDIPSPELRINAYAHQLSGGMRQRVMIAMALSSNPDLLIADEPTTALDVTIQAQILDLMAELKQRLNTAIMLITHDLGVVASMCDNVAVMYAGRIVEYASVSEIFKNPLHPYTKGLLNSIPRLDRHVETLYAIKGMVPNLSNMPKGCSFCPRCESAMPVCTEMMPAIETTGSRQIRCWLYSSKL